jgi:hypothetical protein
MAKKRLQHCLKNYKLKKEIDITRLIKIIRTKKRRRMAFLFGFKKITMRKISTKLIYNKNQN